MDNNEKKQQLSRWLTEKFLAWQTEQGEPKDWRDFAAYLDVGEGALGTWRNRRSLPDLAGIVQIAKHYPEIYDVLNVARPEERGGIADHIWRKFTAGWNELTPEQQAEVEEFFSTITAEELIEFVIGAWRLRGKRFDGGTDVPVESKQPSGKGRKGPQVRGHLWAKTNE